MRSPVRPRRRARPRAVVAAGVVVVAALLGWAVVAGCSDPPDRERVDAAIAAGPSGVPELVEAVAEEGITEEQAGELLAARASDDRPLVGAVLDAIAQPGADGMPTRDQAVRFAREVLEADGEGSLRAAAEWVDALLAPVYLPGANGHPVSRSDLASLVDHAAPVLAVLAEGADSGDVSIPGDDDLGPEATCRFVGNAARELAVASLVEVGVVDGDLDVEGRVAQLVDHLGEDTYAQLRAACVDTWSTTTDD